MAELKLTVGVQVTMDEEGIAEFGKMLRLLEDNGYGDQVQDFRAQLRTAMENKLAMASAKQESAVE